MWPLWESRVLCEISEPVLWENPTEAGSPERVLNVVVEMPLPLEHR